MPRKLRPEQRNRLANVKRIITAVKKQDLTMTKALPDLGRGELILLAGYGNQAGFPDTAIKAGKELMTRPREAFDSADLVHLMAEDEDFNQRVTFYCPCCNDTGFRYKKDFDAHSQTIYCRKCKTAGINVKTEKPTVEHAEEIEGISGRNTELYSLHGARAKASD